MTTRLHKSYFEAQTFEKAALHEHDNKCATWGFRVHWLWRLVSTNTGEERPMLLRQFIIVLFTILKLQGCLQSLILS